MILYQDNVNNSMWYIIKNCKVQDIMKYYLSNIKAFLGLLPQ